VIPLARMISVREWVIGRSRIKIVDVVDWFTNILCKWAPNLTIHSQMVD